MNFEKYQKYSKVTLGLQKADLVLKNARIINVFTEEIILADVAITEGIIVGIGGYSGIQEKDLRGKYLCPGFIDSHLHLESTLVTPSELIYQAVQCGTTTFIVDPHESANVSGLAGIDYILNQTEEVPANVYIMMPSCVPATEIDDNGYSLPAEVMEPYLNNARILGLGEIMNYVSVIEGDIRMHKKLDLFQHKIKDGHAPFLNEFDLEAYVMAGIVTDHECVDYEYALKERRNGMTVLIREGSAAKNLEAIVCGIVKDNMSTENFCFCTDDKHIEDIRKEGHINFNVKKAIRLGVHPIKAIKMATIQPARCYGLQSVGAIAVGYQADIVVFDDLQDINIQEVYHKGKVIDNNSKIEIKPVPDVLKNTINIREFNKEKLRLNRKELHHVIQMEEGQITTKDIVCGIPGSEKFKADAIFQKIAVIERHKATGKVGVGIVTGFHLYGGAIASSVSHDSHNIIVIGDNDEDMELAVNELIRKHGGYTITCHGEVFETLELPIMGLMSDAGFETVNGKLENMIKKAHLMGVPEAMDPFITMSFMALPVIPEIRITPRGVFNVKNGEFYS